MAAKLKIEKGGMKFKKNLLLWNYSKSIKILKIWWKKGNNSKMGNGIYFKIAEWVDLDMPHNLKLTFISSESTRPMETKLGLNHH
jgi:hypothetical protein